jgi:hypothetical protein
MGDETNMSGGWVWAFLIIALIFNGGSFGFGGGNANVAAYATMADVNSAINNQSTQQGLAALQLASANNNYETARLIDSQTNAFMQANQTNLVNAIQGFNTLGAQIANQTNVLGSKIDNLGFQMENCCCSIKQLIKDNQIADLTSQLAQANTAATVQAGNAYVLAQMGHWTPNTTTAGA